MTDYRPSSTLLIWLIVAGVLLPLVYILSVGPVYWLIAQGYLSTSADWIYLPLGFLSNHCPPFQDAMDWYVGFFQ